MVKLKRKIIIVLFLILTFFLGTILFIFNVQEYYNEKSKVTENLIRVDENIVIGQAFKNNEKVNNNPIFIDATIYTILYNNKNEIEDIINHSNNNVSNEEMTKVAGGILNNKNNKITQIGNLYTERYSYSFKEHNKLIIADNYNIQQKLIHTLKRSILIFTLLEIVIIISVLKITDWITKPVVETFNKQKTFISDASHELKTPIAVIMANGDALEKEPNEKKWLNNIRSEAERMNELVTNLLDLAKLENADKNSEEYNITNVSNLTEKSVLTFESLMYEKKIKLKYDIQKDITFKCNDNQIKQLIAILVDNAIEYTEEKGDIIIKLKKEKNDIIFTVSNKGKEIKKEEREKIFERFYRSDESRNREKNNYGLGLAIAKNIVQNHHGKISVDCLNGYTTFTVILK